MSRLRFIPVARCAALIILFFGIELVAVYALHLDSLNVLLQHHWQFADLNSLALEPFTSWIYIHSQPPLLNIFVAVFLWINDQAYADFIILNCLCAALSSFTILFIVNRFSAHYKWLGYCFAAAYLLAPSTLLNSAYPYYPALTSAGYSALALSFFTAAHSKRLSLTLLCASLIFLTLLRSSFPPITAVVVLGIYFALIDNRINWKRNFLMVMIFSLIPITTVYTKNFLMYDFWGSGSWAPINLAKGFGVPVELNYFPTPEQINRERPDIHCEHSYRSIDQAIVKKDGNPNYNSCYFLAFAQTQRLTAWEGYEFKQHIRRVISHLGKYLSLPDKYEYLSNRTKIQSYANTFNTVFLPWSVRVGYDIRLTILLIIASMPYFLWLRSDKRMIGLYAICIVHMVTHVITDGDESDRFVFDIEFCFYIFAAFLCLKFFDKKIDLPSRST
jgi:hypothetical protein